MLTILYSGISVVKMLLRHTLYPYTVLLLSFLKNIILIYAILVFESKFEILRVLMNCKG